MPGNVKIDRRDRERNMRRKKKRKKETGNGRISICIIQYTKKKGIRDFVGIWIMTNNWWMIQKY